jgi:hypothetical protein
MNWKGCERKVLVEELSEKTLSEGIIAQTVWYFESLIKTRTFISLII